MAKDDLLHNIRAEVVSAVFGLRRSAIQLAKIQKMTGLYRVTFQHEKKKLALEKSTIIDVMNIEDQYQNAIKSLVNQKAAYASALVHLRYIVGLLMDTRLEQTTITMQNLTKVPDMASLWKPHQSTPAVIPFTHPTPDKP